LCSRSFEPVDVPCVPLLEGFQVLDGGVWDVDLAQKNGLAGEGLQVAAPVRDAGPSLAAGFASGKLEAV
jgi:hypothetical protein